MTGVIGLLFLAAMGVAIGYFGYRLFALSQELRADAKRLREIARTAEEEEDKDET